MAVCASFSSEASADDVSGPEAMTLRAKARSGLSPWYALIAHELPPLMPTPGTRNGHHRRDRKTNQEHEDPDKASHIEQQGRMVE